MWTDLWSQWNTKRIDKFCKSQEYILWEPAGPNPGARNRTGLLKSENCLADVKETNQIENYV